MKIHNVRNLENICNFFFSLLLFCFVFASFELFSIFDLHCFLYCVSYCTAQKNKFLIMDELKDLSIHEHFKENELNSKLDQFLEIVDDTKKRKIALKVMCFIHTESFTKKISQSCIKNNLSVF